MLFVLVGMMRSPVITCLRRQKDLTFKEMFARYLI